MLDEQLASNGPFDVVLWDLSAGMSSHPWTPVLAGGRAELFGRSGLVIAASEGQDVPRGFHAPGAQTLMLLKPFTPTTLMVAVNAAVSWSLGSPGSRSPLAKPPDLTGSNDVPADAKADAAHELVEAVAHRGRIVLTL
jgi:hypothetical protein